MNTKSADEQTTKSMGRPRKDGSTGVIYDKKLYQFLLKNLPEALVTHGRLNVPKMAEKMSVSKMTIYRWLNEDRVSLAGAKALINISKKTDDKKKRERITLQSIESFVI